MFDLANQGKSVKKEGKSAGLREDRCWEWISWLV